MIRRSVSARPGVAPPTARDRLTGRRSPHVTLTQSPGSYVRTVQSVRAAAPLPSITSESRSPATRPDPRSVGRGRAGCDTGRRAGQVELRGRRAQCSIVGLDRNLSGSTILDKFTFYTRVHASGKQFFTLCLFVTQTNEFVSKNLYYIHSQPHCLTFRFKSICLN